MILREREKKDMKTWQKVLIIILSLCLIAGYFAFDAFFIAPRRITTRRTDITNVKIPNQLDEVQILFFADLDYGTYVDEARAQKLIDHINNLAPDIVIFGGDLYDTDAVPNENENEQISRLFRQIKAPLGKFAVLGDSDARNEETAAAMVQVLNNGDFEVLRNQSINLHNTGSQSITLVGLDSGLSGFNAEQAYSTVSHTAYVIAVCHTPDSALNVPADLTDYFLAAHSHAGQVWYLFGSLYEQPLAEQFFRGRQNINNEFFLDITSGFGTRMYDVRFLTNCEVAVYTLHNLVIQEEVKLETEAPAQEPAEEPAENEPPAEEENDVWSEAYDESETFEYYGGEETTEEVPVEEPSEQPAEEPAAEEAPAENSEETE